MICSKQYCCRLYLQLQPGRLSCFPWWRKNMRSRAVDSYQLGIFMSEQTREPCMPRSGDPPGQTGNWWTKTTLPSQVGPLYQVWITTVAYAAAPGISIMLIKIITVIQYTSSLELWLGIKEPQPTSKLRNMLNYKTNVLIYKINSLKQNY